MIEYTSSYSRKSRHEIYNIGVYLSLSLKFVKSTV